MKQKKEIISDERKTGDLQNICNVLGPITRKMLGKKAFAEADVICNWRDIVGNDMADYSKPVRIDFKKGERSNGVLIVEVAGGAFALEIQSKSKLLIDKVNSFFGYQAVEKIKILQNHSVMKKRSDYIPSEEKKLVTQEEENYINSLSGGVKTPGLEQALQKLGQAIVINNKK